MRTPIVFTLCTILLSLVSTGCAHKELTAADSVFVFTNQNADQTKVDHRAHFYFTRAQMARSLARLAVCPNEEKKEKYAAVRENIEAVSQPGIYLDIKKYATDDAELLTDLFKNEDGYVCCDKKGKLLRTAKEFDIRSSVVAKYPRHYVNVDVRKPIPTLRFFPMSECKADSEKPKVKAEPVSTPAPVPPPSPATPEAVMESAPATAPPAATTAEEPATTE